MNTCKTCKWWDADSKAAQKPCNNEGVFHGDDPSEGYIVGDGSEFLITGPDFGCTLHEPKE